MDIPEYLKSQIDELDRKIAETTPLLSDPSMAELAKQELSKLEAERQLLLDSVSTPNPELPTPNSDPLDRKNIILEIRGAAGGEEAKSWGEDLLRMYSRFAQAQGWKVELIEEMALKIAGKEVYGKLKYESGAHRVQRVPKTESSGRVHTSTATVAILPELEDIDVHIEPSEVKWDFYRSGGKGGQNVNKVNTAVRLTYLPTNLVVTAQSERSQEQNRELAMKKMRGILWEKEQERVWGNLSAERKAQVGTGMRNEKIRTYNFLQDRVTDHRLNENFHNIEKIMEGEIGPIIEGLEQKFVSSI